jgi:hypothetical protein
MADLIRVDIAAPVSLWPLSSALWKLNIFSKPGVGVHPGRTDTR